MDRKAADVRFFHFNTIAPGLTFVEARMRNHRSYKGISGWQIALRCWPAGWLVVHYQRHREDPRSMLLDVPGGYIGGRLTLETWTRNMFSPCNFAFAPHDMVPDGNQKDINDTPYAWFKCAGCGMGSSDGDVDNGPKDLLGVAA